MINIQKNVDLPKKDTNIKIKKISTEDMEIPTTDTIALLYKYNYNCEQLKIIARYYKLKQGGNKNQLFTRILLYLTFSQNIIPIQSAFRGFIYRKFIDYKGPGLKKREECVNQNDFLTMDSMNDIPYMQFYSFKDIDGFIYGFDMTSLYNLIYQDGTRILRRTPKNPYNRNTIPQHVFNDLKRIIRLSKLFNIKVDIEISEDEQEVEKTITERVVNLCMKMDAMGHYTNIDWFLSLSTIQIRRYVRELTEIWNYRAAIGPSIKREICPRGDPLRHIHYANMFISEDTTLESKQKMLLDCLEKMVGTGINDDSKALGAYYVLGALTLVNRDTALAMPWLYDSFEYI